MPRLLWDQDGSKTYETGVNQGVLYVKDAESHVGTAGYAKGVAWNGLTTVNETPTGGEANDLYADNQKYLSLMSAEDFGGSIEAYTYPDEFAECDGQKSPVPGLIIGQQERVPFAFCYKTLIGDDAKGTDLGYKLKVIYNAKATPSERAFTTVNDNPEAIQFSWDLTTTPVSIKEPGFKPTSFFVIDSRTCPAAALKEIEDSLYGQDAGGEEMAEDKEPTLLTPDEIIAIIKKHQA